MNSIKKSIALLLGLILVFGTVSAVMTAKAISTATELRITFVGDEADKAGFAQSIISVTPGDNSPSSGYYLVYYTDGKEVLRNYDEVASIKITDGGTVSFNVPDGTMLPVGAKGIAVFESTTRFVDATPSISTSVATALFPENKILSSLGTPEFTFGAVSDVHMNYEQYDRGAYKKWENVLSFFANEGMEYVVVAGDMTGDRGETPDLEEQYQQYVNTINSSDIDFNKVIECAGNHGNTDSDVGLMNTYLSGSGEVHPYTNSPYFHVLVKGSNGERDNLFIVMRQEINATGESSTKDNFSKAQIDWLEGLLKTYSKTETNIFILEHSPFLNYGAGDKKNGGYTALVTFKEEYPQTMRLKGLLETYKDVIVMSGHTHVSLYDGYNYSDEYNAFARTVHIGSTAQPCAYGGTSTYTRNTDGRYEVTPTYGSEGYTVKVYSDYIVYTGYNLSTGKIIPLGCILIPTKAYGGAGNPNLPKDPSLVFEGEGTLTDPYIIADADDFMAFTAGFNASNTTVQSEMYGYGKYFLQTADIDMTDYYGYCGTEANGNAKCYFAGNYNGNGYSLTVNINGTNQRSVFPYVYGTICNLVIKGSITSEVSAQPVRTLYGSVINCVFDVDVFSDSIANGIIYSNYGYVYNVYSIGTMSGVELNPVASNDTSKDYINVYYSRTDTGGAVLSDAYGTSSSNLNTVTTAFNKRSGTDYSTALSKSGGVELKAAFVQNGYLMLTRPDAPIVPPQDTETIPENAKTLWVTHIDDNSVEGAGVIITKSDTNVINAWAWRLIVVFKPIEGLENVYEISEIYNHLDFGETNPDVISAHSNSKIPDGGFIYTLNYGNNYIALGSGDIDYTSPNCSNAIADALTWQVGDKLRFYNINMQNPYVATSTPNAKWYDDNYVCSSLYAPYKSNESSTINGKLGDINNDGDVDQYDYILAKRIHFNNYKPTADEAARGDVWPDGKNDQYDYLLIKRVHFGTYKLEG